MKLDSCMIIASYSICSKFVCVYVVPNFYHYIMRTTQILALVGLNILLLSVDTYLMYTKGNNLAMTVTY